MTTTNATPFRTQALAILTVQHGRDLADQISELSDFSSVNISWANIVAVARRFAAGEVNENGDLVALRTLEFELGEFLSQEFIGTRTEAHLIGQTDDEEVWDSTEVPVYSDCGEPVRPLYESLQRFSEVRQQLIDHVKAEQLCTQLLG
jgi:hypothetical protein